MPFTNTLIPFVCTTVLAVCKFDSGKIHLYGDRLGSYDYAVKQVDYFSTDSTDFWSLWQCYIDEAPEPSASGYCNLQAFFEFYPEESTKLYQHFGICQTSQVMESREKIGKRRSVFFIVYRGSASHECLLALKNQSNVGVLERTEVARIGDMHYQLDSLLSNRTDKESSAAFPFLDGAIMTLKNRNTSLTVLKEVLASSQKHLEASACLSICEDLNISSGELLSRCGIYPITVSANEEEDVNRLIEKLGLSKEVTSEAPASGEQASTDVIDILDDDAKYIIVMENVIFHHSIQEFYDTFLYEIHFLPRYNPFLNPCEEILSQTKSNVRRNAPIQGREDLLERMKNASQLAEVSSNVLRLSHNENQWVVISPKSLTDVRAELEVSIEENISQREEFATDHRHLRYLLVAPEFVSPIEILNEIADVFAGETKDAASLKIASVISCVDPRMCLMGDEGFILPGLRAFFELGWSNIILFTSPTSVAESVMKDAVTHAIRVINPRAIIMAAPNGRIKDMFRLGNLLDDDVFDDPKLQRHRLLTFPQLYPDCGVFSLLDLQVTFSRRLDRKRWNSALSELRTNLSPFSESPLLLRVTAYVGFSEDTGRTYSISYYSQSDALRENVSSQANGDAHLAADKPFSVTATFLVSKHRELYPKIVSGSNQKSVRMLTEWLKDWLRGAAPQHSLPMKKLSLDNLTSAMLEDIHERYHLYPMPPGWYYTGSQYVHMSGEKSFKHPCFEQYLKEHIEKENARIAKFNEDLVKNPTPDLFG